MPPGPRLGDVVVEATDLIKGYGDRALIGGLSFTLPPAGIVGVVGPNGAGKTTLLRLITGEEEAGRWGDPPRRDPSRVGYVRPGPPRARSAADRLGGESRTGRTRSPWPKRTVASRAYVSWFNFSGGATKQRKVGTLSGGERNRVHLAKLLRGGANLLLLDEPTNDLDVDTLRALERTRSSSSPAVSWSSATTAGSSTASRRTSSPSRGTARWSGSPATTPTTRRDRRRRLGRAADPAAPYPVPEADARVNGKSRQRPRR